MDIWHISSIGNLLNFRLSHTIFRLYVLMQLTYYLSIMYTHAELSASFPFFRPLDHEWPDIVA